MHFTKKTFMLLKEHYFLWGIIFIASLIPLILLWGGTQTLTYPYINMDAIDLVGLDEIQFDSFINVVRGMYGIIISTMLWNVTPILAISILMKILFSIFSDASVHGLLYKKLEGENIDKRDILSQGKKYFWKYAFFKFIIFLLGNLMVLVFAFFIFRYFNKPIENILLLPSSVKILIIALVFVIIHLLVFFFLFPSIIIDGIGFRSALKSSFKAGKKMFWKVLGFTLLLAIPYGILKVILQELPFYWMIDMVLVSLQQVLTIIFSMIVYYEWSKGEACIYY